ncbi:MAG: L,D-transpeptidase family protein [Campylobacterales bacterium]|nr:L,D-transpeptidase family protein [Campylobacterales bacterium]
MRFITVLILLLHTYALSAATVTTSDIASYIGGYVHSQTSGANSAIVSEIYAKARHRPLWVTSDERVSDLLKALKNIKYNYKNKSFNQKEIEKLYDQMKSERNIDNKVRLYAIADIKLTDAFVSLVRFVHVGDVDWDLVKRKLRALRASNDIRASWEMSPKSMPSSTNIYNGIVSDSIENYLDVLIPMKERYASLVTLLNQYQRQKKPKKKLDAIIVNLDKTKLYPRSFENEHVLINLPDYRLHYYRDGMELFQTNIVVGKISRPTPMFDDYIKFVVLNPTWNVPDSLIKRDLIHVLKYNPNYLEENNIYVNGAFGAKNLNLEKLFTYEHSTKPVPYSFVQHAGKTNALGRIKFMFPNKYAVYLHDTDNKYLLDRKYRIYSSGCMRVKNPMTFFRYLMGNQYDEQKTKKILDSLKPTTVHLPRPVPIHILYFTVYVENNKAYFKYDIYAYDMIIAQSTQDNRKETFVLPQNRFFVVDDKGNRSPYDPEKKMPIEYEELY